MTKAERSPEALERGVAEKWYGSIRLRLKLLEVKDEAVADVSSLETIKGFVHSADRQDFALCDNTMLIAEVKHLLCLCDPTDV